VGLGLITLAVPPLRHYFLDYAHGAAGVLMVSAFIVTVIHAAYLVGREKKSAHRHRYQVIYWVIAVLMLVFLIAVVTLHVVRPDWWRKDLEIIVSESVLILLFAAYWVVQTIELWDFPDRRERLPKAARDRLEQGRTKPGLNGLKSELFDPTEETRDERLLRLL
jgi:small-conductance mechanosensitive channel